VDRDIKSNLVRHWLIRHCQRLWHDEEGQTTTEYILILAVVVMLATKFKSLIGKQITSATDKISKGINDTLSDFE
jgi:Flp pilus assembly pilin Flp